MKIKVKMSCGHWVKTKATKTHHPFGGFYWSISDAVRAKCKRCETNDLANDIVDGALS
jgi:hypothetical protein